MAPFDGGLVWSASRDSWLLPALRNATGREGLSAADVFLRLRFCPARLSSPPSASYPNPFGAAPSAATSVLRLPFSAAHPAATGSAGDGGGGGGDETLLRCGSAAGAPAAEGAWAPAGEAAGGISSSGSSRGRSGEGPCGAARRLLQCSQAYLYLSELKEASLARQGEVEVAGVEWADAGGDLPALLAAGEQEEEQEGGAGGEPGRPGPGTAAGLSSAQLAALRGVAGEGDGLIAVRLALSRPFLPLFVSLESPAPGQWLENGGHLLPWDNATSSAHFVMRGAGRRGAGCPGAGGCGSGGSGEAAADGDGAWEAWRGRALEEFRQGLSLHWLQRAMETAAALGEPGAAPPAAPPAAPAVNDTSTPPRRSAAVRRGPGAGAAWVALAAVAALAVLLL